MVLMTDHQSRLIMAQMEKLSPVSTEQKFIYTRLASESEDHFLAIGFYIFMAGFMAALFLGKKFLKTVKDLHAFAIAVNSGDKTPAPFESGPASAVNELKEIALAMTNLSRALKEKEDALAQKNQYVGMMLDALWMVDRENLVTDINPALTELLGYKREDIIGFTVFEFMGEKSEKTLKKHLLACEEGLCSSCELTLISKQGDMVPAVVYWSPILSEKGETAGKLGIMKDFRREAGMREALREAGEYQRSFMDSMPERSFVVDEGLNVVMSNRAARENAVLEPDGKQLGAVCGPDGDCAALNCPVKLVFLTGRPQKESLNITKDRKQVSYEITAYPIKDGRGKDGRGLVKHALVVIRDSSEKRRAEDKIAQKERELAALTDFAEVVNRSLRGEEVFRPAIDKLVELTGMDGGCVFIMDEMGGGLVCKYRRGPLAEFFRENGTFKKGEDIPGRAVLGDPFTTADLAADPRAEKSVLRQAGIRACAAFPIPGKEKKAGVLLLFSFSKQDMTQEDENIINQAVRLAGMSYENIRLYEKIRQLYDQLKWKNGGEETNENN